MQAINTYYSGNNTELQDFITKHQLNKEENLLIQIFTSVMEKDCIDSLINFLKANCNNARIIGASTIGEILQGKVSTGKIILSFLTFEKSSVETLFISCTEEQAYSDGIKVVESIVKNNTKALIILGSGRIESNYSQAEFLEAITDSYPDIVIAGGVAGNQAKFDLNFGRNFDFDPTFVFTEEDMGEDSIAIAALNGESLTIQTGFNLGWQKIGRKMQITEALQDSTGSTHVMTIDNISPIDLYKKYFGDEVANNLLKYSLEYLLVFNTNGMDYAAIPTIIHEDGSVTYMAQFQTGTEIQFGFGDANLILHESMSIAKDMAQNSIEALFIYSCGTRRKQMLHYCQHELAPFNQLAPMTGFFTGGEYYHHHNRADLLTQTMTIMAIAETSNKPVEPPQIDLNLNKDISYKSMQAMKNLVTAMTLELEEEKATAQNLLLNVLPLKVADELKQEEKIIANEIQNATVLFADIVDFTKMSSSSTPASIVGMLNNIFSSFDDLLEKYNLEKIKTIGDAYMLAGGVPEHMEKSSENVAFAALEMLEIVKDLYFQGQRINMRIGMHFGPLVAGVLGTKKFAYDLWGDTVNTASRMESEGIPGKIHVSEELYTELKDKFVFRKRGMIELKGKGKINSFFLLKKII